MPDIHADLERILKGKGVYPYSATINPIVYKLLSKEYGCKMEFIETWCLEEYRKQDWINKFDKARAKWFTYLSMRVMYCMMALKDYIEDDPNRNYTTISGVLRMKLEEDIDLKYQSTFDLEKEYYKKTLRDVYIEFLGEDLAQLMLVGMPYKQIAEELDKEYTSLCKTISRRMEKLKEALIDRELV